MIGRVAKLVVFAWLVGEWYTRGGREFLFGGEREQSEEERLEGLRRIRSTMSVMPPDIRHTFTDGAARRATGMRVTMPDGTDIGQVVVAERTEAGWLRVMYDVDRAELGYPVTVAVGQAEQYVSSAVSKHAVKL